ncbi:hypothetical protein BDN71DRAFT_1437350 [Pleurotus eryngii]|uniref:EGF-like domain-containing protein n=1 Tax=Pleurotus eryngii TaxID=5323 RepID=A0A9P6CZS1_PLEER|nr:hypothetical protein BDN71DRAFT_1437350 [Pleurotus eryngii]
MRRNLCLLPPGILAFLRIFILHLLTYLAELTNGRSPPIVGSPYSPQPLYTGQSAFAPLPISANSSLSTPLSAIQSVALSSNTWIALDNRAVLWDSLEYRRGHFGATCQSCEAGCLDSPVKNVPATCNCLNGICGANGECACNAGFVKADNGTALLTRLRRADGTSVCLACKSGFTQDANDRTKGTHYLPSRQLREWIPEFDRASTASKLQCTACIPGSFLSNGQCVDACPAGTAVSSQDNFSCTPCDSSCTSCAGAGDLKFCLSCTNNRLATSDGKSVQSPSSPTAAAAPPAPKRSSSTPPPLPTTRPPSSRTRPSRCARLYYWRSCGSSGGRSSTIDKRSEL